MRTRIKTALFVSFLLLSSLSVLALTRDLKKGDRGILQLNPSDKNVILNISNTNTVVLPGYEKINTSSRFNYSFYDTRLDTLFDYSTHSLEEAMAKRNELNSLSQKLGVELSDTIYLEFYREAAKWIGTRYHMGSMSRKAVDCSGFTNIIYNKVFNKKIPRVSTTIANSLTEVLPVSDLNPGDLVFFATRGRKNINHVGIYIGKGHFVHASIRGVKVSDLTAGYYKKTFRKAGRI